MEGMSLELIIPRETDYDPGASPDAGHGLRPALFATYTDLTKLRYDYPLILLEGEPGGPIAQSLSAIVDGILRAIAPPGAGGERLRKPILNLEGEIRARASHGGADRLSRLWRQAEDALLGRAEEAARGPLGEILDRAREALDGEGVVIDGAVVDCDAEAPARVLRHGWAAVHATRAKAFRKKVEGLILKLSDILKADFMKSDGARNPDHLRSSVGTANQSAFDFDAMSRILTKGSHRSQIPEDRRQRIHAVLSVLQTQRFYGPGRASEAKPGRAEPYGFVFDDCTAALEAFRSRLPDMVEIVKAIAIAELEIENRYRASAHDRFFARFDESALGQSDLALFPSYLICLREGRSDSAETARALEILASDVPAKILVQTDDILGNPSLAPDRSSFGGGSTRLAAMAVGANSAYVLQTPASNLYRSRQRVLDGLAYDGPALFSIFSGSTRSVPGVPAYLLAAAAMESRLFPTFAYDPAAGPDWASRFHVGDNPQAESDWPAHALAYEDEEHQRVTANVAFTSVDFAVCDGRYARHCVPVPRSGWHDAMTPVHDYLALEAETRSERVPYVWVVDPENGLHRAVLDDKLIRAGERCREMWRGLQELGGINNSHAARLLDRERAVWEQDKERELGALRQQAAGHQIAGEPARPAAPERTAPAAPAVPAAAGAPDEAAEPADAASGEPFIETARCTTCHECIQINNRMFAYDENMQAYIADPDAGTFRQLVEAAESCQVSVIHPGKPRDPDEANLDDLVARAEPFA